MDNRCISCGAIIPEGRLVCPVCEEGRTEGMKMADNVKGVEIDPVREKLIALIQSATDGCATYWAGLIADNLIANGVTVQNWIPVTERLPEPPKGDSE